MSIKDLFASGSGQPVPAPRQKTDDRSLEGWASVILSSGRGRRAEAQREAQRNLKAAANVAEIIAKAAANPHRKTNSALLLRAIIREHGLEFVYETINEHITEEGQPQPEYLYGERLWDGK